MILFSKHAREQISITVNEVEMAIKCGQKELQKPDKILFYYGYFVVVAKKKDDNYFILTVKTRW